MRQITRSDLQKLIKNAQDQDPGGVPESTLLRFTYAGCLAPPLSLSPTRGLQKLFTDYLPGGFTLTGPTVSDNAGVLAITGLASIPFLPEGLHVVIDFGSGRSLVRIALAAPEKGRLLSIADLAVRAFEITVDAKDCSLRYDAELQRTGLPPAILDLLGLEKNLTVAGAIDKLPGTSFSRLSLATVPPVGKAIDWPGSLERLESLQLAVEAVVPVDYSQAANAALLPHASKRVALSGTVVFAGLAKELRLSAALALSGSYFLFEGEVQKAGGGQPDALTLADLGALANGAALHSVLPATLPFVSQVGLQKFLVGFRAGKKPSIAFFHIEAGTPEPGKPGALSWEIIPGIVKLEQLRFVFDVKPGASGGGIAATVGAWLQLGNDPKLAFGIAGSYPDFILRAFSAWPEDEPVPLAGVFSAFGNSPSLASPYPAGKKPAIDRMEITLDAPHRGFAASLSLVDPLSVALPGGCSLDCESLLFHVAYAQGQFSGGIGGRLALTGLRIGEGGAREDIELDVSADHDAGNWSFSCGLAEPFQLSFAALLQRFSAGQLKNVEALLPKLDIQQLFLSFSKTQEAAATEWSFQIATRWRIPDEILHFLPGSGGGDTVDATLFLDRNSAGSTCTVAAALDLHGIALSLAVDYHKAGGTDPKKDVTYHLALAIGDALEVRGDYDQGSGLARLEFDTTPSLGQILDFLVQAVFPSERVVLPDPWHLLYDLRLPAGTTFDFNFKTHQIGVELQNLDFDLGVLSLSKVAVTYLPGNAAAGQAKKVQIEIDGKLLGQPFQPSWNALDPAAAPKVPGKTGLLELSYLGLGQRISPADLSAVGTVSQAIELLGSAFDRSQTAANGHPLGKSGKLRYDPRAGWLLGANFTLMDVFELGFVFDDPQLYGLSVGVKAKPSAKPFGGLRFEILYKKVNDTTGVYYTYLKLPEIFRHLEFGEVSVTLPNLKLWVYTDGSFTLDLGFPYQNDWTDCFGLEIFPFVGEGGFYFGVLKGQDVRFLPDTHGNGAFDPVVVLGAALRVGVGKEIQEGILAAGVSLTVAGILQGFLTFYRPADGGDESLYFGVSGSLAIIGKVYGSVSFAVISARFDLTIYLGAQAALVLYQPLQLHFHAYVSIELTVSIHLLFTIHVHLSFSASIAMSFTLGEAATPPWAVGHGSPPQHSRSGHRTFGGVALLRPAMPELVALGAPAPLAADAPWTLPAAWRGQLGLELLFAPHYTRDPAAGLQLVAMLHLPIAVGAKETDPPEYPDLDAGRFGDFLAATPDHFLRFAAAALRWALFNHLATTGAAVDAAGFDESRISFEQLSALAESLAAKGGAPFTSAELQAFLGAFALELKTLAIDNTHVTLFPMLPWLQMAAPGGLLVRFGEEHRLSAQELAESGLYFDAARPQAPAGARLGSAAAGGPPAATVAVNLAELVLLDYLAMMVKEGVSRGLGLMKELALKLDGGRSFGSRAAELGYTAADLPALLLANRDQPLAAGQTLQLPRHAYTVQPADCQGRLAATLETIAASLGLPGLTGASLLTENAGVFPAGAAAADAIPGQVIDIPQGAYAVAAGDTLEQVARRYHLLPRQIASLAQPGLAFGGLFPAGARLRFPAVRSLKVDSLLRELTRAYAFAHMAGMGARFLLHGVQLRVDGATRGLYQATGQQIAAGAFHFEDGEGLLLAAADAGGAWPAVTFPAVAPPLAAAGGLLPGAFLAYAFGAPDRLYSQAFGSGSSKLPALTTRVEEPFATSVRKFACRNQIQLHLPEKLAGGKAAATLWQLPRQLAETLAALGRQVARQRRESPRSFLLEKQTHASNGALLAPEPLPSFRPATLLGFEVRRVPQPQAAGGFVPNAYEIHGVDGPTLDVLKDLLGYAAGLATLPGADARLFTDAALRLLYDGETVRNNQSAPPTLATTGQAGPGRQELWILQTHFSQLGAPRLPAPGDNALVELCRLLLEAGATRSGGYVLHFQDAASGQGLPDHLFPEQDADAVVRLLITWGGQKSSAKQSFYPFQNYVLVEDAVDPDHDALELLLAGEVAEIEKAGPFHQGHFLQRAAVHPPGVFGFRASCPAPAPTTGIDPQRGDGALARLYNLVGYAVKAGSRTFHHQPIGHGQNAAQNFYDGVARAPSRGEKALTWDYSASFAATALVAAGPAGALRLPLLPPAAENPYRANGQQVEVDFHRCDIYGNTCADGTPAKVVPDLGYTDPLIGLAAWPNVVPRYLVAKPSALAGLGLTAPAGLEEAKALAAIAVGFNALGYLPEAARQTHRQDGDSAPAYPSWVRKAAAGAERYRAILYQWNAADVTASWGSTLENPQIFAPDSEGPYAFAGGDCRDQLVGFAHYVHLYLQALAASPIRSVRRQIPPQPGLPLKLADFAEQNYLDLATLLLANEGLATALPYGSRLRVPSFAWQGGRRPVKSFEVVAYPVAQETALASFLTLAGNLSPEVFALFNPGVGHRLAAGQRIFLPVQQLAKLAFPDLAAVARHLDPQSATGRGWLAELNSRAERPPATSWLAPLPSLRLDDVVLSPAAKERLRLYPVAADATWDSFARETGIPQDLLAALNPGLNADFSAGKLACVPVATRRIAAAPGRDLAGQATALGCSLAFLQWLNPELAKLDQAAPWPTCAAVVPDAASFRSGQTIDPPAVAAFAAACRLPWHEVLDRLGVGEEVLLAANPGLAAELVLAPGLLVEIPRLAQAGGGFTTPTRDDFTCLAKLKNGAATTLQGLASRLGLPAAILRRLNPDLAFVVPAGAEVYLPAAQVKLPADLTAAAAAQLRELLAVQLAPELRQRLGFDAACVPGGTLALPAPAGLLLAKAVDPAGIDAGSDASLFELQVKLQVRRTAFALPGAPADVMLNVATIQPDYRVSHDAGAALAHPPLGPKELAADLEQALPGFKVCTTHATAADEDSRFKELWLLREADAACEFGFGKEVYYALPPLAGSMVSGQVTAFDLEAHDPSQAYLGDLKPTLGRDEKQVDLELLLRDFLAAIDELLLPETAIPAFRVESAAAAGHTGTGAAYPFSSLLQHKYRLAEILAGRLAPVFGGDPPAPADAKARLRDELLIRLANAGTFDCLVHLPVDGRGGAPFVLHGKFAPPAGSPVAFPFSLSAGQVALQSQDGCSFLFTTADDGSVQSRTLPLGFTVDKVEFDRRTLAVDHLSLPISSWLTPVFPFAEGSAKALEIPVVLHDFPGTPAIPRQDDLPLKPQFGSNPLPAVSTLAELKAWHYSLTYKYLKAAQDHVDLGLLTNGDGQIPQLYPNPSDFVSGALQALFCFHDAWPTFKKSFATSLVPGLPAQRAANYRLLQSFEYLVRQVVTALAQPETPRQAISYRDAASKSVDSAAGTQVTFDEQLDIVKTQQALGFLFVTRNWKLRANRATNPAFLYQSPIVQFKNPVQPLLDPDPLVAALDLARYRRGSTAALLADQLTHLLEGFFQDLLQPAKPDQRVAIGCCYRHRLHPGDAAEGCLDPQVPVLMVLPSGLATGAPPAGSIALPQVAGQIAAWHTERGLPPDSGAFDFDISLFIGDGDGHLPRLRLRKVFFALADWPATGS